MVYRIKAGNTASACQVGLERQIEKFLVVILFNKVALAGPKTANNSGLL